MAMVTPLRITSAPVRRQGSVRFSHWLRPPLTATVAPVQMAYTQSLTATAALINQLAQEHETPDESRRDFLFCSSCTASWTFLMNSARRVVP